MYVQTFVNTKPIKVENKRKKFENRFTLSPAQKSVFIVNTVKMRWAIKL